MVQASTNRKPQGNTDRGALDRAVLILSGVKGDTRRYRIFHLFEQLKLVGVRPILSHVTDSALLRKAEEAGVVILHRVEYDGYVDRILREIRSHGGIVILDIDDLVFSPEAFEWIDSPDFQDPVRASLYRQGMQRQRRTLELSDAVMASTQYLAERARELGKPTWIHRNAFSLEMAAISEEAFQKRQGGTGKVIIGYASGTPTHNRDFAVAKPAIRHILQRYPEAELWIIGPLDPGNDWGSLRKRIKQHRLVPWRQLPYFLARFDINIAPLVMGNPFGQSKSEIKYVEAGLVRVPTIASKTNAFEFAIRTGENGYLVTNDDEWVDSLEQLVEHEDRRQAMGGGAYADVLERYDPAFRAVELVTTLNQVHEHLHVRPPWEKSSMESVSLRRELKKGFREDLWIKPDVEQQPSLFRMALYTLRRRGLQSLLMQMWIYFRRLIAPLFPFKKS